MNRRYTIEEFEKGVQLLRNTYQNVALTTDVIVGFPGETDNEFNTTYAFLEKIKFYKMHIFKYSQRKGTKAAIMPNQIDGSIKEERSKKLIELSDRNEIEQNKRYIGKELKVLFEEFNIENGIKYMKGHTTNYIAVLVETDKDLKNEIKTVKIRDTKGIELIGEL